MRCRDMAAVPDEMLVLRIRIKPGEPPEHHVCPELDRATKSIKKSEAQC